MIMCSLFPLEVTTAIKVQQQQITLHAVWNKVLTLNSLGLLIYLGLNL